MNIHSLVVTGSQILADATNPLGPTDANSTTFWTTGLGEFVKNAMFGVAVLLVIFAALKAVKYVLDGSTGKAVKVVLGAIFLAVFLVNPNMISTIIDGMSALIGMLVSTVSGLMK